MLVEIPLYIEQIIKQQAEQQGITAEQLAEQTLTKTFRKETAFNFDIERMQHSINSGRIEVPDFESMDEFLAWVNET